MCAIVESFFSRFFPPEVITQEEDVMLEVITPLPGNACIRIGLMGLSALKEWRKHHELRFNPWEARYADTLDPVLICRKLVGSCDQDLHDIAVDLQLAKLSER